MEIIWGSSFKKAYKKITKADPQLKNKIIKCLGLFANDPFHSSLNTHKLSGKLKDLWAFSVDNDCRVVFNFLDDGNVIMVDIGKHDEVY
ncbi:TPA: type II toxin-antitoxin system mRNA interferase toxin, RelE/StbE family [bacterium]|nr:type II toxin-antitoxin system mRNA interferase toxin, RelE/StbE family [bacterium]